MDTEEPMENLSSEHGLGDQSRFMKKKDEGNLTDEIAIECLTLNDRPFKGSLTFQEMRNTIPTEILGLNQGLVHAIRTTFDGCKVVKLLLKDQIDLQKLKGKEFFELKRRSGMDSAAMDIVKCKIRGIKRTTQVEQVETDEELDNGIRWVSIEGCDYSLEAPQIC